jgi:hypothetical protein
MSKHRSIIGGILSAGEFPMMRVMHERRIGGELSDGVRPRLLGPLRPRFLQLAQIAVATTAVAGFSPAGAGAPPQYDHVVIAIMENHSYSEIIGSMSAPYINDLALQGALFTQSFGVTHPSQPNYLLLYSGDAQGIINDTCLTGSPLTTDNLGAQLIDASFTFVGYSEDLPAEGSTDCTSGLYARKHNPWVNFSNVPAASNQPFTSFPSDFTTLPTLSFVIPNQCNDMHSVGGTCTTGIVELGDTWLHDNLDAYAQWAKTHNSLFILTFDEDDSSQSNQIATIFVGALVVPGDYAESINHFTVLATLQAMYGLAPALGGAADKTAITDVWDVTLFKDGFE